jgi:hypothetical protein
VIINELQTVLDVINAARGLTLMQWTDDGWPIVGPVGWQQLQQALGSLGFQDTQATRPVEK